MSRTCQRCGKAEGHDIQVVYSMEGPVYAVYVDYVKVSQWTMKGNELVINACEALEGAR